MVFRDDDLTWGSVRKEKRRVSQKDVVDPVFLYRY